MCRLHSKNITMVIVEKQVMLLKSRGEDETDKYEKLLTEHGFTVKYLQILAFEYNNLETLRQKLNNSEFYSGIIFTSPRAVTATKLCLKDSDLNNEWIQKDNLVVGESTYELCKLELGINCKGKESGNANNLADLIISENIQGPFLFPCGNLKKETLGKRLKEHYILLDATTVYDTVKSPTLENDFKKLTNDFEFIPEYMVYFSPSGVKFTAQLLKSLVVISELKLIAIGPSTEEALKNEKLSVHSVAAKPNEVELLNILLKD